jgi:thiamine pyrophosphokinase
VNTGLIIANGILPSIEPISKFTKKVSKVFLVDGAANSISPSIKVDYICGDFDSISIFDAQEKFPSAKVLNLSDQNYSDLEKTINYARELGITSFYIIGIFGGRIDHSLSNLSLLAKLHKEIVLSIIDEKTELILLSPNCIRKGFYQSTIENGATVSLAAGDADTVVSISGVKWPLVNQALPLGTMGVSNQASGGEIQVRVHSGIIALTLPVSSL